MGMPLEFEHLTPLAAGGTTTRANLWLSCHRCNEFKGDRTHEFDPTTGERVTLFNPRTQRWREHFQWSEDGALIIGLTSCGRATIVALHLNNEHVVSARYHWAETGWHPPAADL
jgi:hypothetical protein